MANEEVMSFDNEMALKLARYFTDKNGFVSNSCPNSTSDCIKRATQEDIENAKDIDISNIIKYYLSQKLSNKWITNCFNICRFIRHSTPKWAISYIASMPNCYDKQMQIKDNADKAKERRKLSEHIGSIGETMKLTLTITKKSINNFGTNSYTMLCDNNIVHICSSKNLGKVGDILSNVPCIIKSHGKYSFEDTKFTKCVIQKGFNV